MAIEEVDEDAERGEPGEGEDEVNWVSCMLAR